MNLFMSIKLRICVLLADSLSIVLCLIGSIQLLYRVSPAASLLADCWEHVTVSKWITTWDLSDSFCFSSTGDWSWFKIKSSFIDIAQVQLQVLNIEEVKMIDRSITFYICLVVIYHNSIVQCLHFYKQNNVGKKLSKSQSDGYLRGSCHHSTANVSDHIRS